MDKKELLYIVVCVGVFLVIIFSNTNLSHGKYYSKYTDLGDTYLEKAQYSKMYNAQTSLATMAIACYLRADLDIKDQQ